MDLINSLLKVVDRRFGEIPKDGSTENAPYSSNPEYGRDIYRYDLENDGGRKFRKINRYKTLGGMINWTYKDKFYLLGYSFRKQILNF